MKHLQGANGLKRGQGQSKGGKNFSCMKTLFNTSQEGKTNTKGVPIQGGVSAKGAQIEKGAVIRAYAQRTCST